MEKGVMIAYIIDLGSFALGLLFVYPWALKLIGPYMPTGYTWALIPVSVIATWIVFRFIVPKISVFLLRKALS